MLEKSITQLFLITFFSLWNSNALASDTIIVTADRIKTSLDKSPSDIKVFENAKIEKSRSITELLSKESDLKITQSGGPGGNTSIFLRGSDSSHTLVIIDGIIMNDPSNPNRQFDLGRLSLNNIERIEILKGSQGLLYGSNAIGGVILITTKLGKEKLTGSAILDYGTFDTKNSSINIQEKINSTAFSFGIDHFETKGFSAANITTNPKGDDDGEKRTTISTAIQQDLLSFGKLNLNYREVFDEVDLDKSGGAGNDDPNDYQTTKQRYLKVGYNYDWSQAETLLSLTRSTHDRTLKVLADTVNPAQSTTTNKGQVDTVSLSHTHYTTSYLTQNINLDYQHENDQAQNFNENLSLFIYNRFEIDASILNAGLRIDSNKSFGEHLTYKVAYSHNFDPALFKASYSTGFRSPSLNQLYDPTYGNKNLTPEKSQTAELGIEIPFVIHKYNASLFYTELENRFSYQPVSFININKGRARIVGLENVFDTQLTSDLKISLASTWMKAMDTTSKQKLARRPSLNGKLIATYEIQQHFFEFEGDHTGRRADVNNLGNNIEMPSYTIFNFHYNFDLNAKFATYLRIKNILNKDYEEVFGYGTGGRSATLGIKYIF